MLPKEVIQFSIWSSFFLTFVLLTSSSPGAADQVPTTTESKQTTKCQIFIPKIKINVESQGNVFQKNGKSKFDLELND